MPCSVPPVGTEFDRPRVIAAASATGLAAVLIFALLPIIAGQVADRFTLDDVQTGLVASAYFSVYALIAFTSVTWIRRVNWRLASVCGYTAMAVGLLVVLTADAFEPVVVGMAIAGSGAALLFPVSLTLVSDMQHKDRAYAITLAVEQLVPAAVLLGLALPVFAGSGLDTTMLLLLAVLVLCLLFSRYLPASGFQDQHAARLSGSKNMLGVLSLVALAINFSGFAGLWTFMERIGSERDFDTSFTNLWIAVGLITSGIGPILAAILGDRMGRRAPLLVGTTMCLGSLFLLQGPVSEASYAAVLTIMPLSYYFAISYIFGTVADADLSGRMSGLMSFALACGAITGPAVFGTLKAGNGPVLMTMGCAIGAGSVFVLWIQSRLRND